MMLKCKSFTIEGKSPKNWENENVRLAPLCAIFSYHLGHMIYVISIHQNSVVTFFIRSETVAGDAMELIFLISSEIMES
jgi:hypothetical protein